MNYVVMKDVVKIMKISNIGFVVTQKMAFKGSTK